MNKDDVYLPYATLEDIGNELESRENCDFMLIRFYKNGNFMIHCNAMNAFELNSRLMTVLTRVNECIREQHGPDAPDAE